MKVQIKVEWFEGIEEAKFYPYGSTRINPTTWEVDSLFLHSAYRSSMNWIRGDVREYEKEAIKKLAKLFCTACSEAIKKSDGWKTPSKEDRYICQSTTGKTLEDIGLIATRYNTVPKESGGSFRHVSIELRFENGEEIYVPSEVDTLWTSRPFIIEHLNKINFQGGNWVDNSSSHVWEQFFG